jgi:hypothetical protein
MGRSFDRATLERLRFAEEVEIETSRASGAEPHRTVIWVVVDARDRVFIRSVRGSAGRWYREAVAHPACSQGFLAKYAGDRSTPLMLAEANLPTTLQLLPR